MRSRGNYYLSRGRVWKGNGQIPTGWGRVFRFKLYAKRNF